MKSKTKASAAITEAQETNFIHNRNNSSTDSAGVKVPRDRSVLNTETNLSYWKIVERLGPNDCIDLVATEEEAIRLRQFGYSTVINICDAGGWNPYAFARVKRITFWCRHDVESRRWAYGLARDIATDEECRADIQVWDPFGKCGLSDRTGSGLDDLDETDDENELAECIWESEWGSMLNGGQGGNNEHKYAFSLSYNESERSPTEYIWDGILAKGDTAVLSGQPKAGKTVTSFGLAAAIAQGKQFLGRNCLRGNVCYVTFEGKYDVMVHQLKAMGGQRVKLLHQPGPRTAKEGIEALIELAVASGADLIVIDTLQGLLRGTKLSNGAEGYEPTSDELAQLSWVAKYTRTAILFLHHNGKGDEILGSQAIRGGVDTVLNLSKKRVLSSEQRSGVDLPPMKIRYDRAACQFLDDTAAADESLGKQILDALALRPSTGPELRKMLTKSGELIYQELDTLVSSGQIVKKPGEKVAGKRGQTAAVYALNSD